MRFVFLLFGIAFGYVLIVSGVSNYDVIRDMFLLRDIHLYGVLGTALVLAIIGNFIIRKTNLKTILGGEAVEMKREKPGQRHVVGGLLAGLGWALTGACPGPAMAQIGFGTMAGLFTAAGIFIGVYVYGSRASRPLGDD